MKMHAAEPCLGLGPGPVSRRTRSKWDAFYQSLHGSGSLAGKRGRENDDCVVIDDSEVSSIDEDSDDDSSSSISDDDKTADVVSDKEYKVHSNSNSSATEKGRLKVGAFGKPSEKNENCRIKESDLVKKLVDSIWKAKDFEDSILKGSCMSNEKIILHKGNPLGETTLPLKFKFEDCQSGCVEKSDFDKRMDNLFDDLEMGLWESNNDGRDSTQTNEACTTSTDVDESPAARCSRGDHSCVLDEQIGNVCEYCSKLLLPVKYLLPPFCVELVDSPGNKSIEDGDDSVMNQVHLQGLTYGKLKSSIRSEGTVLDLIPDAKKELYPHQLEGFEFLWRNIAGDIRINKLEHLSPDGGRGCIISHSPGTGKTRLTIVFLQTFMKLYPSCHPVIIAPRGMLLSWEQELKKWKVDIRFHNLNENNLSGEETEVAATIDPEWMQNKSTDYIRSIKLISWWKGGSVLGIGYGLFEKLAGENQKRRRGGNSLFKKALLEIPGLLVMDEGHTPRNHQSLMWKALTNVATKRRIILSGTPFQNNFSELYNTLCLVNPQFSHQISSADSNRRGRKPKEGGTVREEWDFLTSSIRDGAAGGNRLKKLRSMIEPFVHIHKGSILQESLPGLRDCLIILRPTDLQKKLLQNLNRFPNFIEQDYISSLILIHPALVANKSEFSEHLKKIKLKSIHLSAGVKMHFLIKLIELTIRLHEKVLVFSEYIDPLNYIQKSLERHFSWREGREIIYMDGSRSMKKRQCLMNSFNDKKSEAKVLLASQKACSEGISLVGASRVVLLDISWNPSVERQAICRAYRIGQERMVYVYHLMTAFEEKKYARQAEKERNSELIFSNGGACRTESSTTENSDDKVLDAMIGQPSLANMVERIIHQPKEYDSVSTFGFVDLE